MSAAFCSLEGSTALVTGASKGIGRAIASELAAAGADRRPLVPDGCRRGRVARCRDRRQGRQADVSDPKSATALVEQAGDVDILVNNAGVTRDGLLVRMSDEDWNTVIDTNLASCFYTCRAAARGMMKKRSGTVVNISSIVGIHGNWGQTNYAASKAGIIGFTKSLARELGSRNVRANVVVPGYVKTQLTERPPGGGDGRDAHEHAARPPGRSARTSPARCGSSAPTSRRSSRARCCSSTAGWGCSGCGGSANGRRRVVITGVGMVTPLGNDPDSTWQSLVAGESGAGPITHFDTTDYDIHFACELKDFEPTTWIDRKQVRRMDRFSQLALSAARMAEADSGISIAAEPERVGAAVATGIGGLYAFENCFQTLLERGPDRTSPFAIVQIIPNMAAAWVSMELGAQGSARRGVHGVRRVEHGDRRRPRRDPPRSGRRHVLRRHRGADHARRHRRLHRDARAVEDETTTRKAASRPFDSGSDGFVMGEAAAMLVLEELEHARARGAKIYGEVLGYGVSSDASHVSDPDPTGVNPARAMRMAFADAGIEPEVIGYVNAHGTSTPSGDAAETRVLKLALGEENAYRTPGLVDEGRDRALPRRGRRGRGDLHDRSR